MVTIPSIKMVMTWGWFMMVYGIVLPTFVRKKHPKIWLSPGHFSPSGSRPVLPGPFWRSGCTAPRRRPLKGPLIHDVARQGFVHIYIIYTHNCVCINIYICVCICMYVYIYMCVCVYCNCPSSKYVTIDLIQKDIPKDHHIAALWWFLVIPVVPVGTTAPQKAATAPSFGPQVCPCHLRSSFLPVV